MDRSDLEVVCEVRAGRSQGGAPAERRNLVALPSIHAEIEVVFASNFLV